MLQGQFGKPTSSRRCGEALGNHNVLAAGQDSARLSARQVSRRNGFSEGRPAGKVEPDSRFSVGIRCPRPGGNAFARTYENRGPQEFRLSEAAAKAGPEETHRILQIVRSASFQKHEDPR